MSSTYIYNRNHPSGERCIGTEGIHHFFPEDLKEDILYTYTNRFYRCRYCLVLVKPNGEIV